MIAIGFSYGDVSSRKYMGKRFIHGMGYGSPATRPVIKFLDVYTVKGKYLPDRRFIKFA
jgi:hypothetical protein